MASSRRVQPARSCRQQPRQQRQHRPSWAMTMYEMKHHLATNADQDGNLWCHMEGCKCTYTPYRVNIWGLRKPELNRQEGRLMIEQQVRNVLRHLKEAHKIEEHLVIKAILPKGTPPFPEMDELLTLRARVGSLQRDVSGLEAIVRNLDKHKKHLDKLTDQLVLLLFDAKHDRPFLLPNGPPEDEIEGVSDLREALHDREERQGRHHQPKEEEEESEEEKGDDDSDLDWGNHYSPPPASDDDDQSEGTTHHTALGGDQEEEEEEEQSPSSSQPPSSSQSTNYSDMADLLMDLTAPGPSHIQTRKRQREGEEDQVPEEFQPLTESTPNDSAQAGKKCRLATRKRPAYEPASDHLPRKRPPVSPDEAEAEPDEEEAEGDAINISLTEDEERDNLVMAALPPMSPRTRLWTPFPPRPPRFSSHHLSSSYLNREVLRWMKEPPTPHIRPQ